MTPKPPVSDQILAEVRAAIATPPFGDNIASNAYVLGLLRAMNLLDAVETHPDHAWVWADGNYFDAVVIHREWRAMMRRYMEAQPGYFAESSDDT